MDVVLKEARQLTIDVSKSVLRRPHEPVAVRYVLRENCVLQYRGKRLMRVKPTQGLLELGTLDSQVIAVELPGAAGGTERIDTKELWTSLRVVEVNIGDSTVTEHQFSIIGLHGGWIRKAVALKILYSREDEDGLQLTRSLEFMVTGDEGGIYRLTGERLNAKDAENVWIHARQGAIQSEALQIKTAGEELLPGPWVLRLTE